MVVESLKKMLPGSDQYPAKFRTLLANMNLDSEKGKEGELYLWNAYRTAEEAHARQLRKSGEPYFEHCFQVALLL
ncbi:MAG: hypothetical protein KAU50_02500, partial [Candidatus Marinimicrobia bacterium]|nr:hypothetical protein [Candidatus Neomarinimicrobiota bacterium]